MSQLYDRGYQDIEVAKNLPTVRPSMVHQVIIYWRSHDHHKNQREYVFSDNGQLIQELITAKCWRIDNLTPGLDFIDKFWSLALQGDNYEKIREKLYFKFTCD